MTTFAELLTTIHQEQFVGRADELRVFDQWLARDLASGAPPILAVCGPGGIGKSWLLEACAQRAVSAGWSVQHIDLSIALAGQSPLLGALRNGRKTLLFVDGIDEVGPASPPLLRDLADLDAGTRVVLAARSGLRSNVWKRWQPLMLHLDLGPLDDAAQRRYLDLRGVDGLDRRGQILVRAGGNPLILSVAVDLVLNSPEADLEASTLWRSTVRASVDELIKDLGPQFRDALDAAAVLQRFDREALTALLSQEAADAAFVRLCTFAGSKVDGDQLTLHDDVRRAVVEDLRLHDPARLELLRRRALRYFRRVSALATGDERLRMSAQRLHMVGRDVFGLSSLYEDDPTLTVGTARADDIDDMLHLLSIAPMHSGLPTIERDPALLRPILEHPDTHAEVARDAEGVLVGYGFIAPISERNRALLGATPAMAAALEAVAEQLGCADGRFPDPSNVRYLSTVMLADRADHTAGGTMGRNILHVFAREGAFVMVPAWPVFVAFNDAVLSIPLAIGAREGGVELDVRLLDLSRRGFEGWLRDIAAGGLLAQTPIGAELANETRRVVAQLDDDSAVAASQLAALAEPDDEVPVAELAHALRQLLARAMQPSGPWPTPEWRVHDALVAAGPDVVAVIEQMASEPPSHEAPLVTRTADDAVTEPQPPSGISITLLGGFEVWRHGKKLPIPHGIVATIIKVVALQRVVTNDELIEILWPDVDPLVGRDRLRTVLTRVRRAVGADIVVRTGDAFVLGDGVSVDAAVFSGLATVALALPRGEPRRAAGARSAVAHHHGTLLPGDRFADWVAAPRERLARLYLDLLDAIADEAEAAGDFQQTIRSLEQAIEVDPYEEQRYVRAIQVFVRAGLRGKALAMLQRAEAAAAALGMSPSPQIIELRQSLRSSA